MANDIASGKKQHSIAQAGRRFAAFISYSHRDEEFGDWLHKKLEGYQVPSPLVGRDSSVGRIGKRLGKVFRDRTDLSASHDLGREIREGLEQSDALIVLCSPRSCGSKYVNEEIRTFKQLGKGQRIFAAIVGGEPHAAGKPDYTAADECFPPALVYQLAPDGGIGTTPETTEPIAADVREGKDGWENGALKLIAGLLDVQLDELVQREEQAVRRRRRSAALIAATVALAALAIQDAGVVFATLKSGELVAYYLKNTAYLPYAHTTAALGAAPSGSSFSDCRDRSGLCPAMVVIPAQAATPQAVASADLRDAAIPRFAVSKYLITFADWKACVAANGCRSNLHPGDNGWAGDDRPVINVNWDDAREYVHWLSEMTGAEYRLLSNAEWAYAAGPPPPVDGCTACQQDWDRATTHPVWKGASTSPVGRFPPNAFGLFDMYGDVFQWVEDCAVSGSAGPFPSGEAPALDGGGCEQRVRRGGSWTGLPDDGDHNPGLARTTIYGFRVARTL